MTEDTRWRKFTNHHPTHTSTNKYTYMKLGYETPEENQKPDPEEQSAGRMPDDYSDDAEALASAGFGTDEDYGYYGGDE